MLFFPSDSLLMSQSDQTPAPPERIDTSQSAGNILQTRHQSAFAPSIFTPPLLPDGQAALCTNVILALRRHHPHFQPFQNQIFTQKKNQIKVNKLAGGGLALILSAWVGERQAFTLAEAPGGPRWMQTAEAPLQFLALQRSGL